MSKEGAHLARFHTEGQAPGTQYIDLPHVTCTRWSPTEDVHMAAKACLTGKLGPHQMVMLNIRMHCIDAAAPHAAANHNSLPNDSL